MHHTYVHTSRWSEDTCIRLYKTIPIAKPSRPCDDKCVDDNIEDNVISGVKRGLKLALWFGRMDTKEFLHMTMRKKNVLS